MALVAVLSALARQAPDGVCVGEGAGGEAVRFPTSAHDPREKRVLADAAPGYAAQKIGSANFFAPLHPGYRPRRIVGSGGGAAQVVNEIGALP